eukprot:TRINITY_DN6299_c0_g2_i1.p1 TRINITY_DN6299_c0_g2~~TRINITY_DN6299_c0_g2_i1.p1  ORF type:complete len:738 (+),score=157.97 TRINITY_DN6299_c0_g2_i1:271-2484(+)
MKEDLVLNLDMMPINGGEDTPLSARESTVIQEVNDDTYEGYFYIKSVGLFGKYDGRYWFEFCETTDITTFYNGEPTLGGKQVGQFCATSVTKVAPKKKKKKYSVNIKAGNKKYVISTYDKDERDKVFEILEKGIELNRTAPEILEEWNSNSMMKMCVDPSLCFDDDFEPAIPIAEEGDLFDLSVLDKNGEEISLRDIVGEKTTLILCLRHFGCLMCRLLCGRVLKRVEDFESLGVQIVAIGTGSYELSGTFVKETKFPGSIFVDPNRRVYQTLGLKEQLSMQKKSFSAIKQATKEGYPIIGYQKQMGSLKQLGGCICLHPDYGVVFQHTESFFGDVVNLEDLVSAIAQFCEAFPDENWTNRRVTKDWAALENSNTKFDLSVLDPSSGYKLERGSPISDFIPTFSITNYTRYYASVLQHVECNMYFTLNSPDDQPCVIIAEDTVADKRCLVFTQTGVERIIVPSYRVENETDLLQYISEKYWSDNDPFKFKWTVGNHDDIKATLVYLEETVVTRNFRVGVLFAPEGCENEDDIYDVEHITPDFEEFLELLGDKVPLKDWPRYKGFLDTKENLNGEYSYFSTLGDMEIMFHVGPMIPPINHDPAKKRYIGNDVVVIIFLENQNTKVDVSQFSSNVNHVYIIVQKTILLDNQVGYKIQVVTKPTVNTFPPYLPVDPVFVSNEGLATYMRIKIINGEKSALGSSRQFATLLDRTRNQILSDFLEDYSKSQKKATQIKVSVN